MPNLCHPFQVPSVSDFKQQFPADFPYAVPAWGAEAIASLTAGGVSAVVVRKGGQGFRVAPLVVFRNAENDTTGTGAAATAAVANGKILSVTVTSPGTNYTQIPCVEFEPQNGDNSNLDLVTDDDVQGGIFDGTFNVNPGIFPDQAHFTRAFCYLAAHQMIEKLKMQMQGAGSQYAWLTASKGAGGVHQSFVIPEYIKNNPFLAHLTTTRYGAMYVQICWPLMIANVHVSPAMTNP